MTTTDELPGPAPGGAGTGSDEAAGRHAAERASAEERGTLEVHPSVVRKVAERAADTVDSVVRAPRRVAGIGAGEHGSTARISGFGGDVDIALDVAVRYPSPVRAIADEVRSHVTDEVHRITGYRARSVHVTVSALLPEPSRTSRVE